MQIIVITPPYALEREAELILAVFRAGAYRVHIRKPDWSREQTAELIESIPPFLRSRITIHDHFDLCEELGVGGLHVNGRNPHVSPFFLDIKSRSCHSIAELYDNVGLDYITLSPIYNSVSKAGYNSNFSYEELYEAKKKGIVCKKTVALGGITPEKITEIYYLGFGGAAIMGYVWQDETVEGVTHRVQKVVQKARMCTNFALQYITHHNDKKGYVEGAVEALEGGSKWIQLRMKGASDEEMIGNGEILRVACDKVGATFIINDRVDLVKQLEADGVHLGRGDISPREARDILGSGYIIGGTANTCEDIDYLVSQGVDYIGLGPFKFTTTKDKLNTLLGVGGYRQAVAYCIDKEYNTPIVAVGGITSEDVTSIMNCGVMGVAVSGDILNAENSIYKTREIVDITKRYR